MNVSQFIFKHKYKKYSATPLKKAANYPRFLGSVWFTGGSGRQDLFDDCLFIVLT
jgi:hypothetical protein